MVVAAKMSCTSGYVINAESLLNMALMTIFIAHVEEVRPLISNIGAVVKSMALHLLLISIIHSRTTLLG